MIPKIIHQIWHEPVYDGAHGTPQSWKDRNPGWDYRHWAFTELSRFVEEEFPQHAELFDANPIYNQNRTSAASFS